MIATDCGAAAVKLNPRGSAEEGEEEAGGGGGIIFRRKSKAQFVNRPTEGGERVETATAEKEQ